MVGYLVAKWCVVNSLCCVVLLLCGVCVRVRVRSHIAMSCGVTLLQSVVSLVLLDVFQLG